MKYRILLAASAALALGACQESAEPAPESDVLEEIDENERRRLELLETRDRALAALKELEFEHRTGTISDDDYRAQLGPLRRDVAAALQALGRDAGEGRPTDART